MARGRVLSEALRAGGFGRSRKDCFASPPPPVTLRFSEASLVPSRRPATHCAGRPMDERSFAGAQDERNAIAVLSFSVHPAPRPCTIQLPFTRNRVRTAGSRSLI